MRMIHQTRYSNRRMVAPNRARLYVAVSVKSDIIKAKTIEKTREVNHDYFTGGGYFPGPENNEGFGRPNGHRSKGAFCMSLYSMRWLEDQKR
jgi:hypothetical protein